MPDDRRRITLTRQEKGRYLARNARGGAVPVGRGADADFTPVELLLAAIAGCASVDVDVVTTRPSEPAQFEAEAAATVLRAPSGNVLSDIDVEFTVRFPGSEGGRAADALVAQALRDSHDRLCTVSRTIEAGTPVTLRRTDGPPAPGRQA